MALFAISIKLKHFFMRLNSVVFKVFICENRKPPFLCLKHPLFQLLHKSPKWTAMRHSHMINVAKHALTNKVFPPFHSSMKTIAWILFIFAEYIINRTESWGATCTITAVFIETAAIDMTKLKTQPTNMINSTKSGEAREGVTEQRVVDIS